MKSEVKSDFPLNGETVNHNKSGNNPPKLLKVQSVAFVLGISLLSFILYKVGFKTVIETIGKIGWGFLAIIFFNGARQFLRALNIYLAVPDREQSFRYQDALTVRLGGEAVGVLTFTGAMASETTKTALLTRKLHLSSALATIVVDNLLYDLSVILMILAGVILFIYEYGSGDLALSVVLYGIAGLMILGLLGFFLAGFFKFKPMTYLLKHHSDKGWMPKFLAKRKNYFFDLETTVMDFYLFRKPRLFGMLFINGLAHVSSVVEIYTALYFLGIKPLIITAFIIDSLTKTINFAFSFIPGNLGVAEGGAAVIFHTLGLVSATGVALALVRRGATLFWTLVGLLILVTQGIFRFVSKPQSTE